MILSNFSWRVMDSCEMPLLEFRSVSQTSIHFHPLHVRIVFWKLSFLCFSKTEQQLPPPQKRNQKKKKSNLEVLK